MTQFSAGELSRARTARRLVALVLIVAGVAACLMNIFAVGGAFAETRLIVTILFLILGPGWCAAGFLRRAPAAHVWLLCVGVGVSVTLLVAQIMVMFKDWQPTAALFIVTGLCIPFLLRHAVVAQ